MAEVYIKGNEQVHKIALLHMYYSTDATIVISPFPREKPAPDDFDFTLCLNVNDAIDLYRDLAHVLKQISDDLTSAMQDPLGTPEINEKITLDEYLKQENMKKTNHFASKI